MGDAAFLAVGVALLGVVGTALGAVLGGYITLRAQKSAEDDRYAREGRAFRRELRTDLIWWATVCDKVATLQLSADHTRNLAWRDVAARSSLYLSDGLALLAFQVFLQRTATEAVYRDLSTTGIPGLPRLLAAQFELRRWVVMATIFLRWMDSDERAASFEGPLSADQEDRLIADLQSAMHAELKSKFGYVIGAEGELLDENYTPDALAALTELIRATQQAARIDGNEVRR